MTQLQIPVFGQTHQGNLSNLGNHQASLFADPEGGDVATAEPPAQRVPRVFTMQRAAPLMASAAVVATAAAATSAATVLIESKPAGAGAGHGREQVRTQAKGATSIGADGVTLTVGAASVAVAAAADVGGDGDDADDAVAEVATKPGKGPKGAARHAMLREALNGLDFLVRNPATDVTVAAFLGTGDAIAFIRDRHDTTIALRRPTVRLELSYFDPRAEDKDEDLAQELIDARREIARVYARS